MINMYKIKKRRNAAQFLLTLMTNFFILTGVLHVTRETKTEYTSYLTMNSPLCRIEFYDYRNILTVGVD